MKTIILTGGGTAGHIVPNLSLAPELHKKGYTIHYFGSENGMEKSMVANYPYITYHALPCVKLIRALTLKNLKIPFVLLQSIKQAKEELEKIKPDVIFAKGGYVSLPVVLAAKDIPILSHESDLSMGLANKIIYSKCDAMCFTFPSTAQKYEKKGVFSGAIIHPNLKNTNANNVYTKHNLSHNKSNLFIVGGSLGSKSINYVIQNNLDLYTSTYNIIHLVGRGKLDESIHKDNYIQIEYTDSIGDYYAWADLILTRGGSNAIHEILYMKKPMLIVPLPKRHSRGDQIDNAKNFEKRGVAHVLLEENLTATFLKEALDYTHKYSSTFVSAMQKEQTKLGNQVILELIDKMVEDLNNEKRSK